MTLGEKLQKLRKARGWTQEELAAQVGVSRQSLSKWESDGALPETANIIVLADLFGVTTDYLLREGEQPASTEEPVPVAPAAQPASAEEPVPTASALQPAPEKQKVLSPIFVIGCILLVMGVIVWLGVNLLQTFDPWTVYVDSKKYTGVAAYIRGNHIELPYYLGIASIFIGAVTIGVTLVLQWWTARSKD